MEEVKETKLKSDIILLIGAGLLILLFVAIFSLSYFTQERPETIDDLHKLNLEGKLKPEQGYLYREVYSFIKFDELWYTQLVSPQGSRFYNIQFRYGPKEVEDIKIGGNLNTKLFNNATDYYVTFNPAGNNFSAVALSAADFNQHMVNIFLKKPIAACDRNETDACAGRPIITCNNTNSIVLYIKEARNTGAYYDNNCIIAEGDGFDLVKAIDRILFDFYGIMNQ